MRNAQRAQLPKPSLPCSLLISSTSLPLPPTPKKIKRNNRLLVSATTPNNLGHSKENRVRYPLSSGALYVIWTLASRGEAGNLKDLPSGKKTSPLTRPRLNTPPLLYIDKPPSLLLLQPLRFRFPRPGWGAGLDSEQQRADNILCCPTARLGLPPPPGLIILNSQDAG